MTETVKINAPRELVERLNKLGKNVEKIIAAALQKEADRLDREELNKHANEAKTILQNVPDKVIIRAIRKSREEHKN